MLSGIFSDWRGHLREIARYLMPRRIRFDSSDHNYGGKRNQFIINDHPRKAHRTLGSGMHAGITSPARPWFRFIFDDEQLMKRRDVRIWLAALEDKVRTALARSNAYNALPTCYEDLGAWGTTAMFIEDDEEDSIRFDNQPVGSYYIALDKNKRPRTIHREMEMSILQVVDEFGLENCSTHVQQMYNEDHIDEVVTVIHIVEPNDERDPGRIFRGWKYRSVWYEKNSNEMQPQSAGEGKFLRESGYRTFPCMIARWSVTGNNAYGDSPAMDCLPNLKQLQHVEKKKLQMFDKIVEPPVNAPSALVESGTVSLLPSGVNPTDDSNANAQVTPIITIHPNAMREAREEALILQDRINSTFYADLFLMLATSPMRPGVTAREVEERHEEKILQLGPVLERTHDELLDPMMERILDILDARGELPQAPADIQDMVFRVEYISILAQAQKLLGTVAIERLAQFIVEMAAANPEVLDNLDFDKMAREYADMLGTPPEVIRAEDMVAQIRERRQQQVAAQEAQMQASAAKDAGAAAQSMSQADVSGDNALTQLAQAYGSQVLQEAA